MSTEGWGGLTASILDPADVASSSTRDPEEIDAARTAHRDLATSWVAGTAYSIPGMGERPDQCGVWKPYHVCDECGGPIFTESHCGLRRCPECWWDWVLETAEKIVTRLMAARWARDDGVDRRLIHAMFSPDQSDDWTIRETEDMMSESYDRADEAGVTGGVALKHMWRTDDDVDAAFEAASAAGLDAGKWSYLREERGKAWRTGTEVSPHVHQIDLASEFEPNRGDWTAKRIRTLEPMYSLSGDEAYEDVAGLAKYILTHTAIRSGEQAVRWFGDLYPGGFNPEEELSPGALETIERKSHEAVYGEEEGDDGDDEIAPEESPTCEAGTENCVGQPMEIWDVPAALRRDFFDVDRETRDRLEACVEWMMGDLDPPPTRSEQAARETLDELVEQL